MSCRARAIALRTARFLMAALAMCAANAPAQRAPDVETLLARLKESSRDALGVYKLEPEAYERAMRLGAKVVSLPGMRPFFVFWLPEGFEKQKDRRLLVALHGTNGNAYRHLLQFQPTARKERFGVVSVQWGWPRRGGSRPAKSDYVYLPTEKTYRVLSVAIEHLARRYAADKRRCAWLGFSRSSTQCALFAFYDKHSGGDYFRLFMAISGQIGADQPMMRALTSGRYGEAPLRGCHFYLWAGRRDRFRVEGMKRSKEMIESLGGAVDILRIGPEDHGGFNHSAKHQTEAVRLWTRLLRKPAASAR